MLKGVDPQVVGEALAAAGLDGWLLYDFRGINPVAGRVVGAKGMGTRRLFVWLPAQGRPVAIAHKIELQGVRDFPGEVRSYASWQELHEEVEALVSGRRIAMETSPDDAVPYLDRIPAGVVGMIERLGGTIQTSARLVSQFAALWSDEELRDHREAAEAIADIARTIVSDVVTQVDSAREADVQKRVLEAMDAAALVTNDPPIVAFGPNAANPHYEPRQGSDAILRSGQVVLLDLWAGKSRQTVFADQTWMGYAGSSVPEDVATVWAAVRDARDAVVLRLRRQPGKRVTGAELDDVARGVITDRGYGAAFVHRTGHSIDLDLHGSGPHLDNFETHDTREIIPGIGFSVEPGVYLEGRFGVRSEINIAWHEDGPEVTPTAPQQELFLAP